MRIVLLRPSQMNHRVLANEKSFQGAPSNAFQFCTFAFYSNSNSFCVIDVILCGCDFHDYSLYASSGFSASQCNVIEANLRFWNPRGNIGANKENVVKIVKNVFSFTKRITQRTWNMVRIPGGSACTETGPVFTASVELTRCFCFLFPLRWYF